MSAGLIAGIALGGALGALARDAVDRVVSARSSGAPVPLGILAVNVVGSFGFGVLLGAEPSREVLAVVGSGFFGGFTTFSTYALQAVTMPRGGMRYAYWSVLLCLSTVLFGGQIGWAVAG